MKFNLTQTHNIIAEIGPYKQLDPAELDVLIDLDIDTVSFDVFAETCSLIINLNSRYRLDKLVYYRDEATTENITVYGKQGTEGHVWQELPNVTDTSSVQVNLNSVAGKFQELKVIHTVSVGTAAVYELEVWSLDSFVGFGETSSTSVYSLDSGTDVLGVEEVQLFNGEDETTTLYCAIDADTDNYLGLSLSTSSSGTFYGAYENSLSIPSSFPWSSGSLHNVVQVGQTITLVSGTYGFYFTPVLDANSIEGRRVFWQATTSGNNYVGSLPEKNTVPTVGVRFSDTAPSDLLWESGELSVDGLWSVTSGTLPFTEYTNNTIVSSNYKRFFQVKVELSSTEEGQTPIIESVGLEHNVSVAAASNSSGSLYAKSRFVEHASGRTSGLVVWSASKLNND